MRAIGRYYQKSPTFPVLFSSCCYSNYVNGSCHYQPNSETLTGGTCVPPLPYMTNIPVYRARKRETKRMVVQRISTIEDKLKRHRRKARIWRRAVKRLAEELIHAPEPSLA